MSHQALVIGISGVIGRALSEHLLSQGWTVHGLSRGRTAVPEGCRPITADLTRPDELRAAVPVIGRSVLGASVRGPLHPVRGRSTTTRKGLTSSERSSRQPTHG